jgi:hypothetical protein
MITNIELQNVGSHSVLCALYPMGETNDGTFAERKQESGPVGENGNISSARETDVN